MRRRQFFSLLVVLLSSAVILHSQQNSTIQGRLIRLGSNEPVATASLELKDADAAASPSWTTTSDQDGKFYFRDIPSGRYRLTAVRNGFVTVSYGQRSFQGPPETITIVSGQTLPEIQITMTPAGVVSGRIYDKAGQPFANVAVGASRISFQGGNKSLQPARSALTYVKSIKLGSEDGINEKLHLDAPPREPMEIVISLNAAILDGRVITSTGQDLNGVTVVLIPDTRNRPETFKSTTTDKDGRFLFERIPPGNYKIFAWEFVENNAWRVPEFLATDEQQGTPVQFVEGARKTVEVPIIRVK